TRCPKPPAGPLVPPLGSRGRARQGRICRGALHVLRGAIARRDGDRQVGKADQGGGPGRRAPRHPPRVPRPGGRCGRFCGHLSVPHSNAPDGQPPRARHQFLAGTLLPDAAPVGNGLKPVFVFEGNPPELKRRVLAKRAALLEPGGALQVTTRLPSWCGLLLGVQDSSSHLGLPSFLPESHVARRRRKQDSETLLTLLGVPYIQAPAEAEATCAALVKSGHAWCAATEDMDALPFGALRLLRHLRVKNGHLEEISLPTVLQKLGMRQEQFVDLCILLGCDYCDKVRGWGLKKALRLLQLHGSIEEVLRNTSRKSHPVPDDWPLEETRQLFLQPEVVDPGQVVLEWKELDEEGLVNFLVHQKCIKEKRVRGPLEKWRAARRKLSEARESIVKGRPRKAAKTMKDFFPVQKRPNKAPTCPPARKKQKLSESSPRDLKAPFPCGALGAV
uniref:XPG-I domain-containing protein n=1 Tax=Naja naja TaxID=35670 RepID=A0A8C6XV43_NAJNA